MLGIFLSKRVSEMTVREFLEAVKKKGDIETINDPNFGLLQVLLREAFTKEQANEMKMEKAWKFYMDSLINSTRMFESLGKGLEKWPERGYIVEPYLKKLTKNLQESTEELEEKEREEREKENKDSSN